MIHVQNVKGTYDFFGKEQSLRKKVQSTLQEVFELYDFDGMDSTILNELDLLTSKYAGGDEILKEMYQLTDQGKRNLGLRYDLTIPFAKVIALNPGIEFPFKRYEIGKVFRDGPVKRGRLREFLQCDVDIVGIEGPEAEAELMQLAVEVFKKLDIPIILSWNNRRFLGEILESIGVPSDEKLSVGVVPAKLTPPAK
nr:ATP phosphoribosyltransferase regulatory subunit [Paenibacillus caui]